MYPEEIQEQLRGLYGELLTDKHPKELEYDVDSWLYVLTLLPEDHKELTGLQDTYKWIESQLAGVQKNTTLGDGTVRPVRIIA